MSDVKAGIDKMLNELRKERDDLRVKLHLAKMEAGDEWKKLDAKLMKLEAKTKELATATADASKDIGAAAKILGEEISSGFKKIAKHL